MKKHGLSKSKIYQVFWGMNNRCYKTDNKAKEYYLDKGIEVCEEWRGFENFENFHEWALNNGYEEGLQLDRIDSNLNYQPSNCRWITPRENARNQKVRKDNKVGCKGVNYDKLKDLWVVRISIEGKRKYIGRFKKLEDAIDARNKAEKQYWN